MIVQSRPLIVSERDSDVFIFYCRYSSGNDFFSRTLSPNIVFLCAVNENVGQVPAIHLCEPQLVDNESLDKARGVTPPGHRVWHLIVSVPLLLYSCSTLVYAPVMTPVLLLF